jgi:ribonuclease HI
MIGVRKADRLASEVGRQPFAMMTERRGQRRLPVMQASSPHFLLYSEASARCGECPGWKFVLQSVVGDDHFSAADTEFESRISRLELLAVVRGLEALDQPSRVTLLTRSRYVRRGIRRELSHWRASGWCWERFGKLVPICDHDLWQRVDRALQIHQVECFACSYHDEHAAETTAPGLPNIVTTALSGLKRGILTPLWAIWRPAFTRAA